MILDSLAKLEFAEHYDDYRIILSKLKHNDVVLNIKEKIEQYWVYNYISMLSFVRSDRHQHNAFPVCKLN